MVFRKFSSWFFNFFCCLDLARCCLNLSLPPPPPHCWTWILTSSLFGEVGEKKIGGCFIPRPLVVKNVLDTDCFLIVITKLIVCKIPWRIWPPPPPLSSSLSLLLQIFLFNNTTVNLIMYESVYQCLNNYYKFNYRSFWIQSNKIVKESRLFDSTAAAQ
jgi:hypothetical protein